MLVLDDEDTPALDGVSTVRQCDQKRGPGSALHERYNGGLRWPNLDASSYFE